MNVASVPVKEGRIPIIRLYRNLIVVIQGSLTDRMVDQLKDEVPRAIHRYDAEGIVISVAGVDVLDSYISRMIYDVALVSRLMGVDTVVCGINAVIALTLVEMGMSMGGVPTELNLERALEALETRRLARIADVAGNGLDDSDDEDSVDDTEREDTDDTPVRWSDKQHDQWRSRRSSE